MPKITIDNPDIVHRTPLSQELETKPSSLKPSFEDPFLFAFQEISKNLYAFRAQDQVHELSVEINLERKEIFACFDDEEDEEEYLIPVITCDFPPMNTQKLHEKVFGDDYLSAMTVIRFQLKILEQALIFCDDQDATHLILNFDESHLDYMEIYQRFVISQEEIMSGRRKQTELTIPTDVEIYDGVIDFMDEVDKKFRHALWRGQKVNPAFRAYLKCHSSSGIS